MPEPQPQLERYSYTVSPKAREIRKQFPPEIVQTLLDLQDELASNPDAHPDRTRKIDTNGEVLVYKHPDPPLEITYEINRRKRTLNFVRYDLLVFNLKQLFISYSHTDAEWLERIKKFLSGLEDSDILRIWDDQKIKPADEWLPEIKKSLESAKLALLLVTQDYLSSDFIKKWELVSLLANAEKAGLKITWIAVKDSTVEDSPIFKFEALNNPKAPLEGLSEAERNKVLKEIYKRVKDLALAN